MTTSKGGCMPSVEAFYSVVPGFALKFSEISGYCFGVLVN